LDGPELRPYLTALIAFARTPARSSGQEPVRTQAHVCQGQGPDSSVRSGVIGHRSRSRRQALGSGDAALDRFEDR
jgi:hypothetical protein